MQIIVSDRRSIEDGIAVRRPYILISIRNPDSSKAVIPKDEMRRAILHLAFQDIEPMDTSSLPAFVKPITAAQAGEIWRFVLGRPAGVQTLVVHCELGVSRSPGVAAGVCQGLGGDATPYFRDYMPNRYVYGVVLTAAGGKK